MSIKNLRKLGRTNKGITLIALVITIIVLLILAGISIATLTGENGILNEASKAKEEHLIEQYKEEINLIIIDEIAERKTENKEELMIVSLDTKIREKEWVNEIYKCNHNGEEQLTFETSTHLLIESKEHYEILIEVNEAKQTAKIVSFQKGTGKKYTITYHPNGAQGEEESVEIRQGFSVTLKECEFTRDQYKFIGWCENQKGEGEIYLANASYKPEGYVTLYAIWELTIPSTADTTPFLPEGATIDEEHNTLDNGFVIRDANNNEWVWIEVPKSIYTNTTYNGGIAPSGSEDYEKIENTMHSYASAYRGSYTDTFYSTDQCGFADATEYNNWKNSMLKSVYENGGFYIGRYEVGTDTARFSGSDALTTPLIQRDKYPYNFVTCRQGQSLSKQLSTGGRISSLMFGIQWDLVMKFIEEKGTKTQVQLKNDSTEWGNYRNANFIIERGKYSIDDGKTYAEVIGSYTKASSRSVVITTGATERNSTIGIYDLAGNVYEWTLEKATNYPCTYRGGRYGLDGSEVPANVRTKTGGLTTHAGYDIAFRPALW